MTPSPSGSQPYEAAAPLPKPASRHAARERALQVLFQWEFHQGPDGWFEEFWKAQGASPQERAFAEELVEGVRTHQAELDQLIIQSAKNWTLERMPVIDRSILRLALYELLWIPDIPAKVTVNEALQLAKRFADEETRRFVNGILDHILKTHPRLENKRIELAQAPRS
ncbi:MAG: transcription antitermination factor NusB [Nitrospirae bacterium]|nr:MAG: transcription antitermination factor NusB [Nitrospirota bacterium]